MVRSSTIEPFLSILLDDPDLLLRQTVEVVDQAVNPAVGGVGEAEEEKRQNASAIHFTPVSDTQDADNFFFLVELVDNPVSSDPDTPIVFRA